MIGQTAIEEQLNKAIALSDSIAWFDAHTDELKELIVDLVRFSQLEDEGIDGNGNIIGLYSEATEQISEGRKQAGDPYTLNDTGAFYRSMFVTVLKDSILIDGDYAKMENQDWWKIDILGLIPENLELYAKNIKENYIIYAREILGIN